MNTENALKQIDALARRSNITAENIIWVTAEKKRMKLSQMETSHLIYILRLVVNQWAEGLGLEPINRVAKPGYQLKSLDPKAFKGTRGISLAIRSRIFALEAIRRLDAGDKLDADATKAWVDVQMKIQECLSVGAQFLEWPESIDGALMIQR